MEEATPPLTSVSLTVLRTEGAGRLVVKEAVEEERRIGAND